MRQDLGTLAAWGGIKKAAHLMVKRLSACEHSSSASRLLYHISHISERGLPGVFFEALRRSSRLYQTRSAGLSDLTFPCLAHR